MRIISLLACDEMRQDGIRAPAISELAIAFPEWFLGFEFDESGCRSLDITTGCSHSVQMA